MEYHLYRSDSRGSIKTYYCSFDVASNESPFDAAKRNLLSNINNTAYFWKRYKSVTKNVLIALYTPNAMDEEQKRIQYFILSKDGPSDDVEEVEETYKGGLTSSQITKYYLYGTDALWNIRSLQEVFDILDFVTDISDLVTPYDTVKNILSDRTWKRPYFEANYDKETGDLCVVMAIHDDIRDAPQLSYYRLSKHRTSIPLELWEITLMGDVRRDGDPINIQFGVGPDDDPMEEAISALTKKICESTSKISAMSSFKKGWLGHDEDSDVLIIFEFRTQFDGHEEKYIINVYEVKKV